jgi:hypothetical protein
MGVEFSGLPRDKGPLLLGYGAITALIVGVCKYEITKARNWSIARQKSKRMDGSYQIFLMRMHFLSLKVLYEIWYGYHWYEKHTPRLVSHYEFHENELLACTLEHHELIWEEINCRVNHLLSLSCPSLNFEWQYGYFGSFQHLFCMLGKSGTILKEVLFENNYLIPDLWTIVGQYVGRPHTPTRRVFVFCVVSSFWKMFRDNSQSDITDNNAFFNIKQAVVVADRLFYNNDTEPWIVIELLRSAKLKRDHWNYEHGCETIGKEICQLARSLSQSFLPPRHTSQTS